jgi:hypothetical protein
MARNASRRVSTHSESRVVQNPAELAPVTPPSTHSSVPDARKNPSPVKPHSAALRARRPGAKVACRVSHSVTGVSAAQIQAVPRANAKRRGQGCAGAPAGVSAKIREQK